MGYSAKVGGSGGLDGGYAQIQTKFSYFGGGDIHVRQTVAFQFFSIGGYHMLFFLIPRRYQATGAINGGGDFNH
jgi:hypothetical protein